IKWPCEFHAAQSVRLSVAASGGGLPGAGGEGGGATRKVLVASAYLEPSQIQDLGDKMDELLKIKAKSKVPIQFHVRVELGDGENVPSKEVAAQVTQVLS